MKKTLLIAYIALQLLGVPRSVVHAQAGELSVTPVVIDEKAKARDILKESITVKNTSNRVLQLYPTVTDISTELGQQGFTRASDSAGLSASLANWIELSRGMVQLSPGEERAIPFIVRINLNAVANTYHAQISFTEGGTRAEAEAKPALGVVTVNLEVQADIKELLQLNKFTTDNVFFSGDDVLFNFQLQNIGNQELQPKGQVHVYNRNGEEVATIDVNKEKKTISPEQAAQLASVWSAAKGFGRYKALLTVDYGSSQTATVQDTVFFWVIPWKQMLAIFIGSLVTIVVLALQFHNWLEKRHLYKFAHAGLLNEETIKKIHDEDMPMPQPVHQLATQEKKHETVSTVPMVVEQKRRFGPLRRKNVPSKEVSVVAGVAEESYKPERPSLKEVLHKEELMVHGSAINLKDLRKSKIIEANPSVGMRPASTAEIHGHVISLKKKHE